MNKKRKNKIKNFAESLTVKSLFLSLFISHFLISHVVFQNYVLCFENDGSVVLESVSEIDNCCNSNNGLMNNEISEETNDRDCSLCEDVAISENCDEKYSITLNKTQSLITAVLNINYTPYSADKKDFVTINKNEINNSPQLDSHKTVLLLI
ncbi:MAG TPA: hypothetical protein PL018_12020 [Ignavibacteriaceae bacterium]|nr:hypothetical protein [Ignavibacterium sp.]HRN27323.1 hypothetical protein [Ignavibacteriaceae bacterium]HRQ54978.1 hypothetical protein [Ignavibacteriaceae bacterium]